MARLGLGRKREEEEQARQELVDLGASTTKTSRGTIYTLTIIGQIVCLTYGEGGLRGCGG